MVSPEYLIKQAERISKFDYTSSGIRILAEAKEFLRVYAGEKTAFFNQLQAVDPSRMSDEKVKDYVYEVLLGFIQYVENGLLEGISFQRKAQIDVVSDFLSQALNLLSSSDVHPAAPTVLIGASLEEFLRNWIEEVNLGLGNKKPGLETYAAVLREADQITKQDMKDITSWGGLRNHAAHGEWEEVQDRRRISLMLEGVNFFMRKYSERDV